MSELRIPRFYGTDLKNNTVDVKDGFSLDNENIYQDDDGVCSKRPGGEVLFDKDESSGSIEIDEIGTVKIAGTKYWFKFSNGDFSYATSATGTPTVLSPTPAISSSNPIWYAVADNKLFFVDGSNDLRYFDGSAILTSAIYVRPTVAATTASGGTGFDFTYTVDNGLGESPACATLLSNKGSTATMSIAGNTGPQTLVVGDKIRVYSRATSVAAASMNVTATSGSNANGTYGSDEFGGYYEITSTTATYSVTTVAIADGQVQLYSELSIALNKSAPTALEGVTNHCGRLVGWKGDTVYNSKSSNVHSWPDNSNRGEVWQLSFYAGDGEDISVCISFRESLYVMKPDEIAVFGGIGPDDTSGNAYSFRRLETNKNGCIAGKSAQVVGEEDKTIIIYMARKGFYATDGQDPVSIGDLIAPSIQALSKADLQATVALHHRKQGFYMAVVGTELNKSVWIYDTREFEGETVGWFKWTDLKIKCLAWDETRYLFGTTDGWAGMERTAGTNLDFSDVKIEHVADASFNTGTDQITVTLSYSAGDQVKLRTTGTLPTGFTANTTYYVVNPSGSTIQLSATEGGSAINISGAGSGTHTIVGSKAIEAYYTTNWLKFGTASHVKKLGRLAALLNSRSSSINITVESAYDWVSNFQDSQAIIVTSSHLWGDGTWGSFIWGSGSSAAIRNVSIARRKCRSVRYKFSNSTINQDLDLLGIEQPFRVLRNRGGFAA